MKKFIELKDLPRNERYVAIAEASAELDRLIRQGEIDREKGEMRTADMYFSSAFAIALEYNWPEKAVNIAAHQSLIFKIRYNTEGENFGLLNGMYAQLSKGLTISNVYKLDGQPEAVIYLRLADYFMLSKEPNRAEEAYAHAVRVIGHNKPEYAEYLSHYALCLVLNNHRKEGMQKLLDAENLVAKDLRYEPNHRKIVLCGIQLRLVATYRHLGDTTEARTKLAEARSIAEDLAAHDLPHRLVQVEQLRAEMGA